MSLKQVTAATVYPVTLAEAKAHCRVTADDDDDYLTALIAAASQTISVDLRRALTRETWAVTLDDFPYDRCIELPMGQLIEVDSVTYYDRDNQQQTLSANLYGVDTSSEPGRVVLNDGESWPSTYNRFDAVTITYAVGYGDGDSPESYPVPGGIKQAILLLIGHLYENREAVTVGQPATVLPLSIQWLTGRYRLNLV